MSNAKMFEAVHGEDAGLWVGAMQHGEELPEEKYVKFIVQKTAKGLWRAAVKGYNGGEFFDAEVSGRGELAAHINDNYYMAIESHQEVIAVDDETMQRYEEAVKETENRRYNNLLVHVLEDEKQGLWSIRGPFEYNDYEEFAQLLYANPSQVGLAWGERLGRVKKAVSAQVVVDGPEYYVKPFDKSLRGMSASAIADRVRDYPSAASLIRDLTEEDTRALIYMNDEFAYGTPAIEAPDYNPIEVLYGR